MMRPEHKPQLQDIHQLTPASTEPGNSGVPLQDEASVHRAKALEIRAAWMRKMGLGDDEIDEACRDDGSPVSLEEEEENLRAANELREITPPISVLQSMAVKR